MLDADVMSQRVVVGGIWVLIVALGTVVVHDVIGIMTALVQSQLDRLLAHIVTAQRVVTTAFQVLFQNVIFARFLCEEAEFAVLAGQAEVDAMCGC